MDHSYAVMSTDVLVIGGGGAGSRAALEAAKLGSRVILAAKGPISKSGLTPTANGGYLTPFLEGDSPEVFFADQVRLGNGLNDQRLVKVLSEEALPCIKELEELGAKVSWQTSNFEPTLTYPRSVLIPGKVLLQALRKAIVKHPQITLKENWLVTRLIKDGGKVRGAIVLDTVQGQFVFVNCGAVVLATGGSGEVYGLTADSPMGVPTGSVGEGWWLASEVGCELVDPEMVQFVAIPVGPAIMKGMRHLPWGPFFNNKGEQFITPGEGPYSALAALQIVTEIVEGRGPVYIDLTDKPYANNARHPIAAARMNAIHELGMTPHQQRFNIDVGSLFCMGGVRINEKTETSVAGLFAAGEVAGNVHGARRVAGNAFPDMIVFGRRAGRFAAEYSNSNPVSLDKELASFCKSDAEKMQELFKDKRTNKSTNYVKSEIKRVMDEHARVLKTEESLNKAEEKLINIEQDLLPMVSVNGKPGLMNIELSEAISLNAMLKAARMIVATARMRKESRGAHYRVDYPDEDKVIQHTRLVWENNSPIIDMIPVEKIEERS